ncbi:hypothetical protein CCAX7_58520 [Capsulimonas corticalis]|uniref:Uncharacterized protein n=1 Tax=Capsulimonas corticalis TaxID=2219043 RepID=A0A402CZW8_9BACT|nr:MARVEL domain-containing protein [Capsulimonas corticalis]BDI33801.1 hypothetical protein CCAX7_58520 [Capsulimonas corticalis]
MSEYNPFEDSMPGKGLHEINNAPKEPAASPTAAAPPINPPYTPPVNPPYEPYVPTAAAPEAYQPTQAAQGMVPPGASLHYAAGQSAGAYAGAPAVRYDLAGNPLPPEPVSAAPQAPYAPPQSPYGAPPPPYGYAGAPAYGAPQAPYGGPQAPYGAPQGAWPPPPGGSGSALFGMQESNTSGQQDTVPPEIARLHWNWGAYFLPILWCRWHGLTTLAGVLAGTSLCLRLLRIMPSPLHPVFYAIYGLFWLAVSIYMGFNGHKMAWRNRRYFGGVEEHLKVQRAWLLGGLLAGPVLWIAAVIFLASVLLASRSAAPSYTPSSYNSPAGGEYGDDSSTTPPAAPGYSGGTAPSDPSYNGPAQGAPSVAPTDGAPGAAPVTPVDPPAPVGFHPN